MIKDPRTQRSIAYSLLLPATVHAECCSLNIGWENMMADTTVSMQLGHDVRTEPASQG